MRLDTIIRGRVSRSAWSTQKDQRLRALWAEGLSASDIAVQISATSRSAVIARAGRLGLPPRRGSDGKKIMTREEDERDLSILDDYFGGLGKRACARKWGVSYGHVADLIAAYPEER